MQSFSDNRWLIVGLGNPGPRYERNRHNLGFMVIDRLARETGIPIKREECRALIGQTVIDGVDAELAKPLTFMNLSGEAVRCLVAKEKRLGSKLLVISDDLALPLGKIRLRPKGSHGGHNGLRSIIDCLGTAEFARLRIGIMPEHPIENTKNFVLEDFAAAERPKVENVLEKASSAIHSVLRDGLEQAMAEWNADIENPGR